MKKLLTAVAILACASSFALAGPNAGGTIFVHYTPGVAAPADPVFVDGGLTACVDAILEAPAGPGAPIMWYAYAAFPTVASPRLKVVTFGCQFDANVVVPLWSATQPGATEIDYPGPMGWPYTGSGKAVGFLDALTATVDEIYCFAGYSYYAGYTFALVPHPDPILGGTFSDDGNPSVMDPIAGYGSLGFGMPGVGACPIEPQPGACCFTDGHCEFILALHCTGTFQGEGALCDPNPCPQPPTGACCDANDACTVATEADCLAAGGRYMGNDTVCDPNPCAPVPVEKSSWGQIKNNYR